MSVYKYRNTIKGIYDGKHFTPFSSFYDSSYYIPKKENLTKVTDCFQCSNLSSNEKYTWCWNTECPNYSNLKSRDGLIFNPKIIEKSEK